MKAKSSQTRKKPVVRKQTGKVKLSPTASGLTSQAGLIPVVKYLCRIGFETIISQGVPHPRGDNADYQLADMIVLTVVGMVGGATSMAKVCAVWSDGVLRKIAGWLKLPVETTISRVFKEITDRQIAQLEAVNHKLRGQVWRRAQRAGTSKVGLGPVQWVDIDSTVDTVCGVQEGAAKGYNPKKKGALSYHPQLAFLVGSKEILQAWFRTGSAYTSNGVVEFVKQLLAHLPNRMRIVIRADSGYFVGALMDLLDRLGHGYLIKVKLKNLTALLSGQHWTPIAGQPGWEHCTFKHRCGGWTVPRSFVAVRMALPQEDSPQRDLFETAGYAYFCYVTTEALTPWQAHKKYGERATCETWIEEAKGQMGLGKIRTSNFLANAALFHCAVLAYNTLRWMALMSGSETLRQWEPETVRTYLVRVAGKLLVGSRQLTVKTPDNHLYPKVWDDWVAVGLGP
ncbi:MAG TPA: IS1380 family transposase [Anaerolineales bacterium]